jgi:hypothetical protein
VRVDWFRFFFGAWYMEPGIEEGCPQGGDGPLRELEK